VSTERTTVVIVDDDPSVRRSLERLLRAAGYRIEAFSSTREFLNHGNYDHPDCLVLDVRMPGQNGVDLYEVLVAAGHDVPVIFITGHVDLPMAERALKAGAVQMLSKPFEDEALLDAIRHATGRRRQRHRTEHPR
jgi:FixJ family two-component response regulator